MSQGQNQNPPIRQLVTLYDGQRKLSNDDYIQFPDAYAGERNVKTLTVRNDHWFPISLENPRVSHPSMVILRFPDDQNIIMPSESAELEIAYDAPLSEISPPRTSVEFDIAVHIVG